jgi:hypothetical protein
LKKITKNARRYNNAKTKEKSMNIKRLETIIGVVYKLEIDGQKLHYPKMENIENEIVFNAVNLEIKDVKQFCNNNILIETDGASFMANKNKLIKLPEVHTEVIELNGFYTNNGWHTFIVDKDLVVYHREEHVPTDLQMYKSRGGSKVLIDQYHIAVPFDVVEHRKSFADLMQANGKLGNKIVKCRKWDEIEIFVEDVGIVKVSFDEYFEKVVTPIMLYKDEILTLSMIFDNIRYLEDQDEYCVCRLKENATLIDGISRPLTYMGLPEKITLNLRKLEPPPGGMLYGEKYVVRTLSDLLSAMERR